MSGFEQELWKTFISSIFYVGKGTYTRPLDHLSEALSKENRTPKANMIRDIWNAGFGVVPLQVFNYRVAKESLTREAAMIH